MTVGQTAVAVWFATSVLLEVSSNFALYRWLIRRDVPVRFIWVGTPGYLDGRYAAWCRDRNISPRKVLLFRELSLLNVIVASAAFVVVAFCLIAQIDSAAITFFA